MIATAPAANTIGQMSGIGFMRQWDFAVVQKPLDRIGFHPVLPASVPVSITRFAHKHGIAQRADFRFGDVGCWGHCGSVLFSEHFGQSTCVPVNTDFDRPMVSPQQSQVSKTASVGIPISGTMKPSLFTMA